MLGTLTSTHITNVLGLLGFLLVWIGLVAGTRLLLTLRARTPMLGWAVGPLGISTIFLGEPSVRFILLSALLPACVSGSVVYIGLFTSFPSPLALSHNPLVIVFTLTCCVLLTSAGDFLSALRDLRYPLWGEARILRTIQYLRASWATIHFTPFGLSYLRDHFGSSPSELLQAF